MCVCVYVFSGHSLCFCVECLFFMIDFFPSLVSTCLIYCGLTSCVCWGVFLPGFCFLYVNLAVLACSKPQNHNSIFPSSQPVCVCVCVEPFRLCLAYGGSDVTRCFFWLLQRAGFPYRECQLTNRMDCMLLQQLKETFCHLDQVGLTPMCFLDRQSCTVLLIYKRQMKKKTIYIKKTIYL